MSGAGGAALDNRLERAGSGVLNMPGESRVASCPRRFQLGAQLGDQIADLSAAGETVRRNALGHQAYLAGMQVFDANVEALVSGLFAGARQGQEGSFNDAADFQRAQANGSHDVTPRGSGRDREGDEAKQRINSRACL